MPLPGRPLPLTGRPSATRGWSRRTGCRPTSLNASRWRAAAPPTAGAGDLSVWNVATGAPGLTVTLVHEPAWFQGREHLGGRLARGRLEKVVHDRRPPRDRLDLRAGGGDHERTTCVLGRRIVMEGELAEAVVHVRQSQVATGEERLRMRAPTTMSAPACMSTCTKRLLQSVRARVELCRPCPSRRGERTRRRMRSSPHVRLRPIQDSTTGFS